MRSFIYSQITEQMKVALTFRPCAILQSSAFIESSVDSTANEQKEGFDPKYSEDADTTMADAAALKEPTNALDPETEQKLQTLDRLRAAADLVMNHYAGDPFNDELADAVAYLYANHLPLRDVFNHSRNGVNRSESLTQSTEYFWKSIDRVRRPDYIPTEEDIMNLRCQSTGSVVWPF